MSEGDHTGDHTGGCMCGAVRYRAGGEPIRVGLCHCETCRRNTGAMLPGFVVYPRERVEITGAGTGHYATSSWLTRHFCPTCGSPVFSVNTTTRVTTLYLGTLDDPEALRPGYELWGADRPSWLPDLPEMRRYAYHRA